MEENIYELKHPVQVADKNGQVRDANFITLFSPNFKQMKEYVAMKEIFSCAILKIQDIGEGQSVDALDVKQEDKEGSLNANMVLQALYMTGSDTVKMFIHAEKLFTSGAGLLDGEIKLTRAIFEKMDFNDFELLVAEYLAVFIAPSLNGR